MSHVTRSKAELLKDQAAARDSPSASTTAGDGSQQPPTIGDVQPVSGDAQATTSLAASAAREAGQQELQQLSQPQQQSQQQSQQQQSADSGIAEMLKQLLANQAQAAAAVQKQLAAQTADD